MNIWENIIESLASLRSNLLRTSLTVLGVIFGVSAVIAMMAIGEGAEKEIMAMINSLGAKNIHIITKSISRSNLKNIIDKSRGLSLQDAAILQNEFGFIEKLAAISEIRIRTLNHQVDIDNTSLLGVSASYFSLMKIKMKEGRVFLASENKENKQLCVVGEKLAAEIWPESSAIGQKLRINQAWFTVVGVMKSAAIVKEEVETKKDKKKSKEEKEDIFSSLGKLDYALLVPNSTALKKVSGPVPYGVIDRIIVQVPSLDLTGEYKSILHRALLRIHNGIEDFEIIAPEELLRQKRKTQNIFNMVLLCISGISLLVGGIGIMNIMLANILERIKEIGIRRSVGARKRDILSQFLIESIVICSLGGLAGVILGYLIALFIGYFTGWAISMSLQIILLSFSISLIVGLVFGILPAKRAANINPIDALRDN